MRREDAAPVVVRARLENDRAGAVAEGYLSCALAAITADMLAALEKRREAATLGA